MISDMFNSILSSDTGFILSIYLILGHFQQIWELFRPFVYLFLYKYTSYRYYIITQYEKGKKFRGQIKKYKSISFYYDTDNNPLRSFICLEGSRFLFIAWVLSYNEGDIQIFTTKETLKTIMNSDVDLDEDKEDFVIPSRKDEKSITKCVDDTGLKDNEKITLYYRVGSYRYFNYSEKNINIHRKIFYAKQLELYNKIRYEFYELNKKNVICFVSGEIGTGKSFFAYLMAREMKGSICTTFNPTDPGDNFISLYEYVNPTKRKPLILVLDEIDIILEKISQNNIKPHKHIPIEVHNKNTWNHLLDDFDYGLYSNVIILMTTNKTKKDIDDIDKSYLREGRVDICHCF